MITKLKLLDCDLHLFERKEKNKGKKKVRIMSL